MGYAEKDIITIENIDHKGFKALSKDLRDFVHNNWEQGEESLVFVYYAGHGVMENGKQEAVLNGSQLDDGSKGKEEKVFWKIED